MQIKVNVTIPSPLRIYVVLNVLESEAICDRFPLVYLKVIFTLIDLVRFYSYG